MEQFVHRDLSGGGWKKGVRAAGRAAGRAEQAGGEAEEIDWDGLYLSARSWGLSPDQIWAMTLGEYILEMTHRAPRDAENDLGGTLTQTDIDTLLAMEWT